MSENITVDKLADDSYDIDVTTDHIDVSITDKIGTFLHPGLTQLNWADAGHTIDTDIDMEDNDILNIKEMFFKNGGSLNWNIDDVTVNLVTGIGPVLQVGQEMYVYVYNGTGATLTNGTAVSAVGSFNGRPSVGKAISDSHETITRPVYLCTMDILNGGYGFVTEQGFVRGFDTSGLIEGQEAYLSATVAGELQSTKPEFPNYPIRIGGVVDSSISGTVFVAVEGRAIDTIQNFWNGTIRETFDFRTSSDGAIITGTLEPANGHPDLTLMFSDGFTTFDTSPPATIVLTAGTDDIPQMNYVYIPESTKVLTVSASSFPEEEHARIAEVYLRTASTTQTDGALKNQNINDHIQSTNTNQGHLSHIGTRLRAMSAEWDSGAETSLSVSPDPSDVYVSNTSGKVFQLHEQTFPALDMSTGADIHIVNDPVSPYRTTNNLNDLTDDSDGDTLNNRWFGIVIWGVCNKTGELSHLMCNLPSGSYTSESGAVADALNNSNYNIPVEFKGTGFLMARFVMRKSGTTFTYNSSVGYLDLRGFIPNSTAGSGAGSSGITTFTGLTDTPSSYVGQSGLVPVVNGGETALEFTEKTPLTTKGDLLTYDTGNARLPVGTDDQVLTADSTQAEGVAWVDGFTRDVLFTGSAGASTINLSGNISDYNLLEFTAQVDGQIYYYTKIVSAEKFTATSASNLDGIYTSRPVTERSIVYYSASDTSITITGTGTTKMTLNEVAGIK